MSLALYDFRNAYNLDCIVELILGQSHLFGTTYRNHRQSWVPLKILKYSWTNSGIAFSQLHLDQYPALRYIELLLNFSHFALWWIVVPLTVVCAVLDKVRCGRWFVCPIGVSESYKSKQNKISEKKNKCSKEKKTVDFFVLLIHSKILPLTGTTNTWRQFTHWKICQYSTKKINHKNIRIMISKEYRFISKKKCTCYIFLIHSELLQVMAICIYRESSKTRYIIQLAERTGQWKMLFSKLFLDEIIANIQNNIFKVI